MKTKVYKFIDAEEGAVTIDWVILAAGVVSLALASFGVVLDGSEDSTSRIQTQLTSNTRIKTSFD